jgi:hypothetical protein
LVEGLKKGVGVYGCVTFTKKNAARYGRMGARAAKRGPRSVSSLKGLHVIGASPTKTGAGHFARGYNRVIGGHPKAPDKARVVKKRGRFFAVVPQEEYDAR